MTRFRRSSAPTVSQVDRVCDRDHFVQFYHNDEMLIESVARYFAVGFAKGDVAVLIATREHREGIETCLNEMGVDVESLQRRGEYSAFDAHEMLERLMVRGMPDARRFRALLGTWLDAALADATGVRAFGEMVALLNQDGNEAAALEMERLWNELGTMYEFTLFCAYPSRQFSTGQKSQCLSRICAAHTRVLGHC